MITFTAGSQLPAADLNANFTELTRIAKTLVPRSSINLGNSSPNPASFTGDTIGHFGMVTIPFRITVNKISFLVSSVTVAGTCDLTLYSEDGQTIIFSVTTATISAAGIVTTSVPSVVVHPGIYYLMVNANGTQNVTTYWWGDQSNPLGVSVGNSLMHGISSEPTMQGTMSITAGTPPTTFNPVTDLTAAYYNTLICRLDN